MCIVCFFLGYFVADVVSKCGFGREHLRMGKDIHIFNEKNLGHLTGGGRKNNQYGDWAEHLRDPNEEIDPNADWAEHLTSGKCGPCEYGSNCRTPGDDSQGDYR